MNKKKHIVIVGATSAIAEQCARLWLQDQPVRLSLVGRNRDKVERIAKDLQVRSPQSEITIYEANFLDSEEIQEVVEQIYSNGNADIVLIAHGNLPNQGECQNDLRSCSDAMQVNGISLVLFAEAFAKHMEREDRGTIALIGSVAGDRGRKSNYVYGAAKGLVTRYAQGLQHRFAGTGVKVALIKPGPTDTPMTAELKSKGVKLAPVEQVAKDIVAGIERGRSVVYSPSKWWLIMMFIIHLPRFVFNQLDI